MNERKKNAERRAQKKKERMREHLGELKNEE